MSVVATDRRSRVIAILDAAHAGAEPDYGGLGRFWHLPPEQLRELQLFGVPLFAPATVRSRRVALPQAKSCCAEPAPVLAPVLAQSAAGLVSTSPVSPDAPRGAASAGIIRGLRGQPPFDGTQFAPMPWGTRHTVSAEDIAFIEAWIEDGMPTEVVEVALALEGAEVRIEVEDAWPLYDAPVNTYKNGKQELRQRYNIEYMSADELARFRAAHAEMLRLNRFPNDERSYNAIALVHQNHCQHAWERFLPWHRIYLYEYEQMLQSIDPSVTLPYWDWTMPVYKHGSTGEIPAPYKAFITADSIRRLIGLGDLTVRTAEAPPEEARARFGMPREDAEKLRPLVGRLFSNLYDFFVAASACLGSDEKVCVYRDALVKQLLEANPLWYPLRYPAQFGNDASGKPKTMAEAFHYHFPSADDVRQILALNNFRDLGGGSRYNDAYGFLDQNPHNVIHIYCGGVNPFVDKKNRFYDPDPTGPQFRRIRSDAYTQPPYGDMLTNLTASYDPIFWPHHVNIDRIWAQWQESHPHAAPMDLDAALTPWNYRVRDTLDINRFGYEYVARAQVFALDNRAPVQSLRSGKVAVPRGFKEGKGRVELRIHRVPQLLESCVVRAFLNLPGANASTRVTDNPHYGGYLGIFGHGGCYGGPGHCDIPAPRRNTDLRDRDHNTPRNHRIDVTSCVRGLVDEGATEVDVTLVVVSPDGSQRGDLLRLDALSLNFLD